MSAKTRYREGMGTNDVSAIPESIRPRVEILAARLKVSPSAVRVFSLSDDGRLPPDARSEMATVKPGNGYGIYVMLVTQLDTEYTRAMMNAGPSYHGIQDPYMLTHIDNAAQLYDYNRSGIQGSTTASIEGFKYLYAVVARARAAEIVQLGAWPLSRSLSDGLLE